MFNSDHFGVSSKTILGQSQIFYLSLAYFFRRKKEVVRGRLKGKPLR